MKKYLVNFNLIIRLEFTQMTREDVYASMIIHAFQLECSQV